MFSDVPDSLSAFAGESTELTARRINYSGDTVSFKRDLVSHQMIPGWPRIGRASVISEHDVVDSHLKAELEDSDHCLFPQSEWR